ncbi:unnamed protein product [Urochloa humidicola]
MPMYIICLFFKSQILKIHIQLASRSLNSESHFYVLLQNQYLGTESMQKLDKLDNYPFNAASPDKWENDSSLTQLKFSTRKFQINLDGSTLQVTGDVLNLLVMLKDLPLGGGRRRANARGGCTARQLCSATSIKHTKTQRGEAPRAGPNDLPSAYEGAMARRGPAAARRRCDLKRRKNNSSRRSAVAYAWTRGWKSGSTSSRWRSPESAPVRRR